MQGRAFLDPADDLAAGPSEAYWRAAAVHAYYALLLECRDTQARWSLIPPPRHNVHAVIRLRFIYAADADLKRIGVALDRLVQLRNQASYDLGPSPAFASAAKAQEAIQRARAALALLDAIDGDPARLATAKASIRP